MLTATRQLVDCQTGEILAQAGDVLTDAQFERCVDREPISSTGESWRDCVQEWKRQVFTIEDLAL